MGSKHGLWILQVLAEQFDVHAHTAAHVGFGKKIIRVHDHLPVLLVRTEGQYWYLVLRVGIGLTLLPPLFDLAIGGGAVAFDFNAEVKHAGVVATVPRLRQVALQIDATGGQGGHPAAEFPLADFAFAA